MSSRDSRLIQKLSSKPTVRSRGYTKDTKNRVQLLYALPPLALYVHVPWCIRRCPYCDFNSHSINGEIPEQRYLQALRSDLEQSLPLIWGRQVVSIFIGGGTPSLLSGAAVDEMISMFRAYLNIWPETEITLEANPGTIESGRFSKYARAGVNRLSLGVQSFNDKALTALGRIHDSSEAHKAIKAAKDDFDNVNLDIMYALPNQTLDECKEDINIAVNYKTNHLSVYHLTLEPNTIFAKYPPKVPDDDLSAIMQDDIVCILEDYGFDRYEVSAYAHDGNRSIHNMNYWEFGDYLGIGPGAHSKLSFPDKVIRQVRSRNPDLWMSKAVLNNSSHIASEEVIEADSFPFEFMLNVLRLRDGVPKQYYYERTGQPLSSIQGTMDKNIEKGLIANDPMRIKATDLGWRFLNNLQMDFLS